MAVSRVVTRLSSRGQAVIPAAIRRRLRLATGEPLLVETGPRGERVIILRVSVHAPDVEVARRVAALAAWPEASLADRLAAATAQYLRARLYTTDGFLTAAARRHGLACTLLQK